MFTLLEINFGNWFISLNIRCHFKTCHPLTLLAEIAIRVTVGVAGTAHTLAGTGSALKNLA